MTVGIPLLTIVQSTWKWSYSISSSAVADVAYDIFTSTTPTGNNVYEIMIWLANYNAGAISYNYDATGKPIPILSGLTIASKKW